MKPGASAAISTCQVSRVEPVPLRLMSAAISPSSGFSAVNARLVVIEGRAPPLKSTCTTVAEAPAVRPGASLASAPSVHSAAFLAKSRSRSMRSAARVAPSASSRASIAWPTAQNCAYAVSPSASTAKRSDLVETRRGIAHEGGIEVDRAARRIALAPGRGEHHEVLCFSEDAQVGVGHVVDARVEPVLLRRASSIFSASASALPLSLP